MTDAWRDGGFGLYVHWPFCQAKCPYCDFNSHVRKSIDHSQWEKALVKELEAQAQCLPDRKLNSIFFGGGTPSLMDPRTVDTIISTAAGIWSFSDDIEITLEANPTSVEMAKFTDFSSAGINRISMGIQALNDTDLKALGRMHSAKEALAAFDTARACFDRVSFDLIYARQNQTLQDWEQELLFALDHAIDHLSLYQLTIEAGTRFGELYDLDRLRGLPSDDLAAQMFELTQEICKSHNMPAYEVSNHAVPGAESRHNLIYWRYGDYLGIGPGAHSRVTVQGDKTAMSTVRIPEAYLKEMSSNTHAHSSVETLSLKDQATEYLLMSLRLSEGSSLSRLEEISGRTLREETLSSLCELGLLSRTNDRIIATERGRILLNSVLTELLGDIG